MTLALVLFLLLLFIYLSNSNQFAGSVSSSCSSFRPQGVRWGQGGAGSFPSKEEYIPEMTRAADKGPARTSYS